MNIRVTHSSWSHSAQTSHKRNTSADRPSIREGDERKGAQADYSRESRFASQIYSLTEITQLDMNSRLFSEFARFTWGRIQFLAWQFHGSALSFVLENGSHPTMRRLAEVSGS